MNVIVTLHLEEILNQGSALLITYTSFQDAIFISVFAHITIYLLN